MTSTAILWYRRDLRVHDHPALACGARRRTTASCPLFVLDDALLGGRYASGARTAFMLGCLRALDARAARARRAASWSGTGGPRTSPALAGEVGADAVYWTSDVVAVRPGARPRG